MSRLLLRTLRDAPGDAEAVSHQLLVRAGFIRRLVSGVYTFMPLGLRVVHNVSRVVREEMDRAGAQELLMPVLAPVELLRETGRDQTMDDVLMHMTAKGGEFVLGPTHEEVVTTTVAAEVDSYRDLPLNVYQVQTKFRDEARPRFGLMRTREFIMKDAYSFDATPESMGESYQAMYDAYCRIFERLDMDYKPVVADAGAIGGDVNHEFMVRSPIGEDFYVSCGSCGYAANIEAARSGEITAAATGGGAGEMEVHDTPDTPTIESLVELFVDRGRSIEASDTLKCITLADAGGALTLALVPGDREVLVSAVGTGLEPLTEAGFAAHPELAKGYIGPMDARAKGMRVVADPRVEHGGPWVTGANESGRHATGVTLGRDFTVDEWLPIASVAEGDPCPDCGSELSFERSVEAAHTFQLGLTYSSQISGAEFSDEDGKLQPFYMGCYGVGISRMLAVIAEAHHDDDGLAWPPEVAPYQVHLLGLGAGRAPEVREAADKLYGELTDAGVAVLYDDRDASPGVMFADADLIGIPTQLVVGKKSLEKGVVERKQRRSGDRDEVALTDIVTTLS
jgi:prolyl-tRNA synthetase